MSRNCFLAVLCLVTASCSQGLPAPADAEQARAALRTSLDAWKGGERPQSLQSRSPAIYFNDELWSAEQQLLQYTVESDAANGQGWRCDVKLSLKDPTGREVQRTVGYQIDTGSAIVIVQQP